MEGESLFNPGFLGSHFSWWIGQIASDSTWRDNILPGKFEGKDQIPGWGRRYKVRIIGLHDQGETEIPSDQLPWAQIMYPVTGGGGQASASATANLRQGMFVFGFFLDGQEQQVPVIMGVLGNNAQTALSTKIGDNAVTQSGSLATSGIATPADDNKDPFIKVPDEGLVVNKPKPAAQSEECTPAPPGVSVNQYGLRADKSLSRAQFQDQQSAIAEADARGLTGTDRSNFIQKSVSDGIKARCEAANSPTSPSQPGATRENVDAVHELSAGDVKRNDYYQKKTVLMSPCDIVGSALKAIQTLIENLTKDIDKVINAALSYIDAVSSVIKDIQALIADYACQIAKYMKIVFDKIFEYVLKKINVAMAPTVDLMFPNQRNKYLAIKEQITAIITCLYNNITNGLCDLIEKLLNGKLNTKYTPTEGYTPTTPMCSVEDLTGEVISLNMSEMENGIDNVIDTINTFLDDVLSQIAEVTDVISDVKSMISGITGSITSALSFENLKLNIFGCDLTPNCAVSDYFTLQYGSGAALSSQQPSASNITEAAQKQVTAPIINSIPFAQPAADTTIYDPINPQPERPA
jgi:archaellum component FlaC